MQKIIDTHVHVFDLNKFKVEWLEEVPILNRPILEDDYKKEWINSKEYRIEGFIHVELDTIKEQKKSENDYFIQKAYDDSSLIKGVTIYGDMLSEDLETFIKPYEDKDVVKGLRYILHVPSEPTGTCLKSTFINNSRLLGEKNIMFEGCLRAEDLHDFYELAKTCDKTTFVLDHMGLVDITAFRDNTRKEYVDSWKLGISKLASLPNVVCKISGLASADVDIITEAVEHCFDEFGEERVMFASNYPVILMDVSLDDWIKAMITIAGRRGEEFSNKFFYKNAEKIYNIGG